MPAHRKVQICDLEGKRLAIDASIWFVQFAHTPSGDVANEWYATEGFLRRILKLLFFGIRPVFVFDGQTPALKRKCVRERQARQDSLNIKKAAERLVHKVVVGDDSSYEWQDHTIAIDYQDEELEAIQESLLDKHKLLLETQKYDGQLTAIDWFRGLPVSEQFAHIERLQFEKRQQARLKYAKVTNEGNLLSFSETQVNSFVQQAIQKQEQKAELIKKN